MQRLLWWVSVVFFAYQIALPVYAFMPNMKERALHLAFALILIFLGDAKKRGPIRWALDLAITGLGVGFCLYVFVNYSAIIEQYGAASGPLQVWMGFLLVLIVLESARRMVRPALPIIASLLISAVKWMAG
jgi:TRAP-type uncharacterized transport system fused permease subunit